MSNTRKLWLGLAALLIASFSVLLWAGGEIFRAAPPMPEKVLAQVSYWDQSFTKAALILRVKFSIILIPSN